jgi:hypothetical protein
MDRALLERPEREARQTKIGDMRPSDLLQLVRMGVAAVYGAACRVQAGEAGSPEEHAREGLRFAELVVDAVLDPEQQERLLPPGDKRPGDKNIEK